MTECTLAWDATAAGTAAVGSAAAAGYGFGHCSGCTGLFGKAAAAMDRPAVRTAARTGRWST